MQKPLTGLKILDIATMMAAPLSATYLADFGAEVIKIEHPQRGDTGRYFGAAYQGVGMYWKTLARNKKSITLNLSQPKGQKIFLELIKDADVLIENFRPGTLEKWGIGVDYLLEINPGLVVLRTSGFGQDGPYFKRAGFGTIAEAMSGFAYMNGYPDGSPTLPPMALADGICSIFGALSIMIALYERDAAGSGKGQSIDICLYEPIMRLMEQFILEYSVTGIVPKRSGNRLPAAAPRNVYKTRDKKWVALSASAQPIVEKLFKAIGREDIIDDPRFSDNQSRVKNVSALDEIIGGWIQQRNLDKVIDILNQSGAVVGPIYSIADLFNDPHFIFRQTFVELKDKHFDKIKIPNVVARFSRTPGSVDFTGPEIGEHNQEIYTKYGFTEKEIKKLKEQGII